MNYVTRVSRNNPAGVRQANGFYPSDPLDHGFKTALASRPEQSAKQWEELTRPLAPQVSQTTFLSILVPLDGTEWGERALPLAVSIAKRAQATLRLVHIYAPLQSNFLKGQPPYAYDLAHRQKQLYYLQRLSNQIEEAAGIAATPLYIERRDVVKGICETAETYDALVIAATRKREWWRRLWNKSVAHALIEQLRVPLLAVRGGKLSAAITPDNWLRKALVHVDDKHPDRRALATATALGQLYDATYSLLGVVPAHDSSKVLGPNHFNLDFSTMSTAKNRLDGVHRRMEHDGYRVDTCMAVMGESPVDTILERAASSEVDCIAIGSDGFESASWDETQPARRLLAQELVRRSHLPVLVVPGKSTS